MMSIPITIPRRASVDNESPSTLAASGPVEGEMPTEGQHFPKIEESLEARLERLGRQRPEVFKSEWAEVGFVFSTCMASVLSVSIAHSIFVLSRYHD